MALSSLFLWWRLDPPADATASAPDALDPEGAVFQRASSGDEQAWQELFDRWKKPLLAFFYRSLGTMPEAEDLTLEVFVRLHRAADRYEPRAAFATFLFHIARNLLLNALRHRRRKPAQPVAPEAFDYLVAPESEEARRVSELEESFQHALAQLPEAQRTLLLLVQQQDLDQRAAATILGLTENALRVQLHRARARLKEIMSNVP
ncbi:RNA polymerase sigma factor [Opitutus sp. ER46]|uniref:RNA polymerase sigma factor n=1 Tax=Opitutus sp. ER46 TaxID=2161864 RepID=UPI001304C730|nr:RNA polymerase sigma factor [Opitutus sp. ER46]